MPATVRNDLVERHSVSSSAPGGDDDFGIKRGNLLGQVLLRRHSEELPTRRLHQLCDPLLRCNHRLPPLLTPTSGTGPAGSSRSNSFNMLLHSMNHFFAAVGN